eukprot:4742794-Amphidinium_carterae.1
MSRILKRLQSNHPSLTEMSSRHIRQVIHEQQNGQAVEKTLDGTAIMINMTKLSCPKCEVGVDVHNT